MDLRHALTGVCALALLGTAPPLAGPPPAVHLIAPADPLQIGLCRSVRLPIRGTLPAGAQLVLDLQEDSAPLTLDRGGAAGPLGAGSLGALVLHTPCLADCLPHPKRFQGVVPISPPCRAEIRGTLRVRGRGGAALSELPILLAASVRHPGTRGLPNDAWIHVAGPAAQGAYLWSLRARTRLGEETALLEGSTERVVRLRTFLSDIYWLEEAFSGFRITLYSGDQQIPYGMCAGAGCHNREVGGWRNTPHATALSRGLLHMRGAFDDRCLPCHVSGYTPGAADSGFDDLAKALGWTVPHPLGPAALRSLPPALRPLAQVGCPSCHGPGKFTRAILEDTVCATCHQDPPRYPRVTEWRAGAMSEAGSRLPPGAAPSCRICHTTRAFLAWQRGRLSSRVLPARPDPGLGCVACHDTHRPVEAMLRTDLGDPGPGRVAGDRLCGSCHRALLPAFVRRGAGTGDLPRGPTDVSLASVRCRWPRGWASPSTATPPPPHRDLPCIRCHAEGPGGHLFGRRATGAATRTCGDCHEGRQAPKAPAPRPPPLPAEMPACGRRSRPARAAIRLGAVVFLGSDGAILGDCDGDGRMDGGERWAHPTAPLRWIRYLAWRRDESRGAHDPYLAARLGLALP